VEKYIGIPYSFGALDCWGLVCLVLCEEFKKSLPSFDHDSPDQFKLADFVSECLPLAPVIKIPFDERQPGDILLLRLWGVACHTAVIIDNNMMLHSLHKQDSGIECYTGSKWIKRIEGVYRVT
jgi:cell wall-associated NlpC family hydrolase